MGGSWIFKRNSELIKNEYKKSDKFMKMVKILDYWLKLKEDKKDIAKFLEKMGYDNIAIYGIGYLGKHLVDELNKSELNLNYIIDKKIDRIEENIKIYKPNDILPKVDIIIVTAITEFDKIFDELEKKMECPVVSLEDIIFGM